MDNSEIMINGINAATGGYLIPPLSPEDVSRIAQDEPIDPSLLADQKAKLWRETEAHLAPVEGGDANDLGEAGWGVVFAHNADPAVRDALKELLEFRRAQAGRVKENFYREFTGEKGYRVGDNREGKRTFLARGGAAACHPADPSKVPYYLMIVGDPATIPYRFQYQLDVEYAVGRVWFEREGKPDLEAFARYARSVVEAESGRVPLAKSAVFVGVQNDDDRATRLSAIDLVQPLAEDLSREQREKGWSFQTYVKDHATKGHLARLLGGSETPAFLFTASHGIGFPDGDPRQIPHQGALLCQDWPGPSRWRRPIGSDFYLAGDDVGDDASLFGLLAFHFACFGAGTPDLDDFPHLKNLNRSERTTIAPRPFVARLPQRLLGHPRGGALAVIGHVERAWGCSFFGGGKLGRQLQTFKSTLTRLLEGQRVGWALEYFNQYYAALSADLSEELENIRFGKVADNLALSEMWTANNDARSFVVVGDPAVRLTFPADGGGGDRPAIRPVESANVTGHPTSPVGAGGATPSRGVAPRSGTAPERGSSTDVATSDRPPAPDQGPPSGRTDGTGGGRGPVTEPGASFSVQIDSAEDRYHRRGAMRESFAVGSVADRVLQKNDPERIRRRLEKFGLGREQVRAFLSGAGTTSFAILPEATSPDAPAAAVALQLERILGRNDMVGGQFLEAGARAARSVARVRIRTASGRVAGFGTGSLVGPRLLLTNNHVLGSGAAARASVVEFNVQEAFDGRPLAPVEFALTPEEFFLTDAALDFTLVAVAPRGTTGADLAAFGWNRAREDDDPVLVEEFVNIVQHPGGRPKQVALRDNQVVDLLDDFLHYRADTEPGSSGAPVFNDQWELIGLHHSGVPRRDGQGRILARGGGVWTEGMDERDIDWVANEGVRLSRILKHVKGQVMGDETQSQLRDGLFTAFPPEGLPRMARRGATEGAAVVAPATPPPIAAGEHGVTITVPLTISLRLGVASGAASPTVVTPSGVVPPPAPTVSLPGFAEAVSIDPEYGNREGYDPEFLGVGALGVPLPRLSPAMQADAAVAQGDAAGGATQELKYHHYSVVLNRKRRLAFFTAVNIDGRSARSLKREQDKWFFDPRVDKGDQVGNEFYAGTPFDRGHLVRRLDPAWGRNERIAKVANDDTFHFSNCSPQHKRFNEGKNLWAGLEDFLLGRAVGDRKRLTVFTGPVFADDDPEFRGVRVPRQFWKVAVIPRPNGRAAALGFLVSQAELIHPVVEEAAVDVARTFQVPVGKIEGLTGLDFGALRTMDGTSVDRFGREATEERELETLDDIRLPAAAADEGTGTSFAVGVPDAPSPAGPTERVPGTDLGYYLLAFDADGRDRAPEATRGAIEALGSKLVTDVWLFSHGWRGDVPAAREQYAGWIRAMAAQRPDIDRIARSRPGFRPLLIGLHWPSEPWGDEELAGALSFAVGKATAAAGSVAGLVDDFARRLGDRPEVRTPLRTIITAAQAGAEPDHLPPEVEEAYRSLDRALGLGAGGVGAEPGSDREPFDPEAVYQEALAASGPAGFGFGLPGRDTLLAPLRTLSFWTMKDRARRFGETAVHPLLRQLLEVPAGRDVRFHLMGHSFGCIVAAATLAGPAGSAALPRPVDSLALIQGAFSLWSFCDDIPFAPGTPGYFRRVVAEGRVRGPIVTTQSRFDTAVGTWYPRAAWAGRQVDYTVGELPKYGAVGSFGVQGPGVAVVNELMRPASATCGYQPGHVYNLEASQFINEGGGFSGAHSDIRKPEVAHAVWQAAMI